MKPVEIVAATMLACGLMDCAAPAVLADGQDNSYSVIAKQNPSNLRPPSPAVGEFKTPPPIIVLKGLVSILGNKRALLKALGVNGERSYLLSEGEQRDGIRLLSVDIKAGVVTVNNQDAVQTIAICPTPTLLAAAASGGAAPVRLARDNPTALPLAGFPSAGIETPASAGGQMSQSGIVPGAGGARSDGSQSGGSQSGGSGNGDAAANDSAGGSGNNITDYATQGYHWWVKEAQNIEQARIATAAQVMNGSVPPYPLTPFTPPDTPARLIGPNKAYFFYDPMAPSND